jgi:hypothetical protein
MKFPIVLSGIALVTFCSAASAAPSSVQSLYDRIPEPPATAAEAAKWRANSAGNTSLPRSSRRTNASPTRWCRSSRRVGGSPV